ncbi:MAG TPA: membrane protein insertion efficiency factor YidD [Chlamydiales bacterium]|jgi:hypothetical protein|nr:membrane protein insertion efficiency factor YidD [Chlamydiales bacterium]
MLKRICFFLIDLYQAAISPFLGHCCRFTPTCSEYAKEAIQKHGVCKGCGKTAWRILRCNPFCRGGLDEP